MIEAAAEAGDVDADRPALLVRLTCVDVSVPEETRTGNSKAGDVW